MQTQETVVEKTSLFLVHEIKQQKLQACINLHQHQLIPAIPPCWRNSYGKETDTQLAISGDNLRAGQMCAATIAAARSQWPPGVDIKDAEIDKHSKSKWMHKKYGRTFAECKRTVARHLPYRPHQRCAMLTRTLWRQSIDQYPLGGQLHYPKPADLCR